MKKFLEILGYEVEDKVTGFKGVAEAVSFELYGCVQVAVRPKGVDDKGNCKEGRYFDHSRLTVLPKEPVMAAPDFDIIASRIEERSTPTSVPGGAMRGSATPDRGGIK